MTAFYNENDPFAAAWLRELIKENLIAPGLVDERDIKEIRGDELREFRQVHLFAGIGGWSYALRLAGWGDDRAVWTGSCPCQPFSAAGKRKGVADARHLWPDFYRLISLANPPIVFGEQVASKDGRLWLAGVRADLEALGYAVGAADLCAAGVGAPHIRQRLFWVADSSSAGLARRSIEPAREECATAERGSRAGSRLADSNGGLARHGDLQPGGQHGQQPQDGGIGGRVADAERDPRDTGRPSDQPAESIRAASARARAEFGRRGLFDFWGGTFIPCADGKARRIEPSIFPLAHGVPNRVGTLRGAGNAIVPALAAEFIQACAET